MRLSEGRRAVWVAASALALAGGFGLGIATAPGADPPSLPPASAAGEVELPRLGRVAPLPSLADPAAVAATPSAGEEGAPATTEAPPSSAAPSVQEAPAGEDPAPSPAPAPAPSGEQFEPEGL